MNDARAKGRVLRLGTRASALALWQANHVRDRLLAKAREDGGDDRLTVELIEITTKGDRVVDRPLNQVGGMGLFVKALEDELLAGTIDLAVHSMKDMPGALPEGLTIACTPARADPRDALVGPAGATLASLPPGTRLGTSSLRRGALARRINPGLEIVPIRGNVPTRIAKIAAGEVDAVLLAAAGLDRLGRGDAAVERLDVAQFCPAACQGILALEIRAADTDIAELLAPLTDPDTATRAAAERAFLATLGGGCQVPMACHATLVGDADLSVHALVVDPSGAPIYEASRTGPRGEAAAIGAGLAETVLRLGARAIVERLGHATQ